MEMRKVLLSTLAMAVFFIGSLALFMFVACSGPKSESTNNSVTEFQKEIDSVEVVLEEVLPLSEESSFNEAFPVQTTRTTTTTNSVSSSSSYSGYSSSDGEGDYWEETRKHSPNDNYLMGFDEDVDDVHDMEIYMEDY